MSTSEYIVMAILVGIPLLVLIGFFSAIGYNQCVVRQRNEKVWVEIKTREEKERKQKYLYTSFESTFYVEVSSIHELTTQDEITRVVNLLAVRTAMSCVHEDIKHRGEKYEGPYFPNLGETTGSLKRDWAKARNLAILVVPELADRMPHFSEFEPLKSYREEHLREMEAKKSAM